MVKKKQANSINSEGLSDPISEEDEALWTVQQVSGFLQLKPNTVRLMASRGELPAIRVGRFWRFNHSELNRWLIENSTENR